MKKGGRAHFCPGFTFPGLMATHLNSNSTGSEMGNELGIWKVLAGNAQSVAGHLIYLA